MIESINKFCSKTINEGYKIQITDDNNIVIHQYNNVIDSFSISDLNKQILTLQLFNTYLNDMKNKDIINNEIISDWIEPNWKYRVNVTKEQFVFITVNYFEIVLALNTEPMNPRYPIDGDGIIIYLNTIGTLEKMLLESMGVEIQFRDNIVKEEFDAIYNVENNSGIIIEGDASIGNTTDPSINDSSIGV